MLRCHTIINILISFLLLPSNDRSLSRDLFAKCGLGSAVIATPELSFSVGCSSEGWRGIVEMIVFAMVSMTSGGGVPALGDYEYVVETVRFMEGVQQDDMEKCDRSLLLMKEMEVKARKKSRFILKLTGYVED
ncbi:hypothetical protein Tco_1235314 [Tanacetum coccineum]